MAKATFCRMIFLLLWDSSEGSLYYKDFHTDKTPLSCTIITDMQSTKIFYCIQHPMEAAIYNSMHIYQENNR
ncbi:hypothetical protein BD408DRAFT_413772 [Parasitella parasitica]|nr:hypothetical protein BD408DRAFT_413772 [Parasitella parasitica]